MLLFLLIFLSLSDQKVFFFFQTDSTLPTSYLLSHLVKEEQDCTEKALLFH